MNRGSTQNIVKHKIWIFDNWVSEVSMSDRNTITITNDYGFCVSPYSEQMVRFWRSEVMWCEALESITQLALWVGSPWAMKFACGVR